MYDAYEIGAGYHPLRSLVTAFYNGEDVGFTLEELGAMVEEAYSCRDIKSTQYDNLIGYLQELGY